MANGDSANPLWIYMTADRAVKSGDVNHPILRKWRDGLKRGVDYRHSKGQISPRMLDREVAQLKADIESAPIAWLRPQVWKLSVSQSDLQQPPDPFPDEYHQGDFDDGKVTLIVE